MAAAYVLFLRDTTFNVMILAGLAVALGIVIDDAVTTVEEIRRRVREHRASDDTQTTASVVVRATLATRGPLLYATLVVLLIPLPALALGGVAGAFAGPLVLSYVLAVGASMLVALDRDPGAVDGADGRGAAATPHRAARRRAGTRVRPGGPRFHPAALGVRRAGRAGHRDARADPAADPQRTRCCRRCRTGTC